MVNSKYYQTTYVFTFIFGTRLSRLIFQLNEMIFQTSHMEGTVSQISYLGLSFYFISKNRLTLRHFFKFHFSTFS